MSEIYGLAGRRIGYSYSKTIHELFGMYRYSLLEFEPDEFVGFMHGDAYKGFNVTIPYKVTALRNCDVLSDRAKKIGCVNTVIKDDEGCVRGFNTDYTGFTYMLERNCISLTGKHVLILGTGGASMTVAVAAEALGAASVKKVSRTGSLNYSNVYECKDTDVIVNATPVGTLNVPDERIIDINRFPKLEAAVDLVYNPYRTGLILDAERMGVKHCGGLDMLVAQAVAAAEIFTGKQLPGETVDGVIQKLKQEKLNIALVGMPGSGKTSVGKCIAEKCGRLFVDTDREIEEREGRSIHSIFAENGEEYFRNKESRVLEEYSCRSGIVIATGGGSPLTLRNRDLIRRNSMVFRLERDISQLPVDGRPLSTGADLSKMYAERNEVYTQVSDYTAYNESSVQECAERILEQFYDESTCD